MELLPSSVGVLFGSRMLELERGDEFGCLQQVPNKIVKRIPAIMGEPTQCPEFYRTEHQGQVLRRSEENALEVMASTYRTVMLTTCIALLLVYSWFAARSYRASRLASSLDVVSLERAIALEPRDAAHQDFLCRYLLFDRQEAGAAVS